MNILLNFIPLKRGGGVQVGLDFIRQLRVYGKKHRWILVATEGTVFEDVELDGVLVEKHLVKSDLWRRLYFELFGCRKLIQSSNADVVYTQFGPCWPGAKIVNVAGCAYSNLMYPEVDFWSSFPLHKKILKKVVDYFRKRRMLGADVIVYETEDLAIRSMTQNGLDANKVKFVLPAVSSLVSAKSGQNATDGKATNIPNGFRVLLFAGYHPNKNIELLPVVAERLRDVHGVEDIVFVITLPPDSVAACKIIDDAGRRRVKKNIYNIGPIPQDECGSLYRAVDAVILPSRLESFSNNIAESWAMEKPLLISDFEWSRSLCGDAAIYICYDDPNDTATKLVALRNDVDMRKEMVKRGLAKLNEYPSPRQRFMAYLDIIEQAVDVK